MYISWKLFLFFLKPNLGLKIGILALFFLSRSYLFIEENRIFDLKDDETKKNLKNF